MTEAASAPNTFPYRKPKGPRTPPPADKPAHYRLSTGTWMEILKEYVAGATAVELSSKWRVSLHAIRKRITQHKATKQAWGDTAVRAQAEARAAEIERARANTPEAKAARLFDDLKPEEERLADPELLGRLATLASGRAMGDLLLAEAKALAGLAEAYSRLAARRDASMATLDDVPLDLLARIAEGPQDDWIGRMSLVGREDDPENPTRNWFWRRKADREFREKGRRDSAQKAGYRQGREAAFREMGMADPEMGAAP